MNIYQSLSKIKTSILETFKEETGVLEEPTICSLSHYEGAEGEFIKVSLEYNNLPAFDQKNMPKSKNKIYHITINQKLYCHLSLTIETKVTFTLYNHVDLH